MNQQQEIKYNQIYFSKMKTVLVCFHLEEKIYKFLYAKSWMFQLIVNYM